LDNKKIVKLGVKIKRGLDFKMFTMFTLLILEIRERSLYREGIYLIDP